MVHPKGINLEGPEGQGLLRLRHLMVHQLEGKLRRNDPKALHHPAQSLGPHHMQRCRPLRIAHVEQHAGQPGNVIRMVMGKAHHVNGIRGPALLLHGDLGSLAAVDQHIAAVAAQHQARKPAIGQGHHAAGAQQTNIQHNFFPLFTRAEAP